MGKLNRPRFHIVKSGDVAEQVFHDHRNWLKSKKRDGTARKDTPMRRFRDPKDQYLEAWSNLEL